MNFLEDPKGFELPNNEQENHKNSHDVNGKVEEVTCCVNDRKVNGWKREWKEIGDHGDVAEIVGLVGKKVMELQKVSQQNQKKSGQSSNPRLVHESVTYEKTKNPYTRKNSPSSNPTSVPQTPSLTPSFTTLFTQHPHPSLQLQTNRLLIFQQKLDAHLIYIKSIRNIRGSTFTQLQRKLGSASTFSLRQLKQILFVVPQLYQLVYFVGKDEDEFPYLIRLRNDTSMKVDDRKEEFRQRLYEVLLGKKQEMENNGHSHNSKCIEIPQVDEKFINSKLCKPTASQKILSQLQKKRQAIFFQRNKKNTEKKLSPFSVLDGPEMFKTKLYQLIKEKQLLLKAQNAVIEGEQTGCVVEVQKQSITN